MSTKLKVELIMLLALILWVQTCWLIAIIQLHDGVKYRDRASLLTGLTLGVMLLTIPTATQVLCVVAVAYAMYAKARS